MAPPRVYSSKGWLQHIAGLLSWQSLQSVLQWQTGAVDTAGADDGKQVP